MDAEPEQNPKKGFEVVHECMTLTIKYVDRHEDLGARSARRVAGCIFILIDRDGEIEIDQKAIGFIFVKQNVAQRDVAVENAGLIERLVT